MSATKTIVVGVDGSAASREALEYALAEAVLRDSSVQVVTVFDSLAAFGARHGIPVPVSDPDLADRVQSQTPAPVDQALAADRLVQRCG
jgi:nucleotide-binding universal stress UspA family protein